MCALGGPEVLSCGLWRVCSDGGSGQSLGYLDPRHQRHLGACSKGRFSDWLNLKLGGEAREPVRQHLQGILVLQKSEKHHPSGALWAMERPGLTICAQIDCWNTVGEPTLKRNHQ